MVTKPLIVMAHILIVALALLLSGCGVKTYAVEGSIVNYDTQQPLSGAVVTLSAVGWGTRNGFLVWDKVYIYQGVTDEQGRFSIEARRDATNLMATKGGYIPYQGWHDINRPVHLKLKQKNAEYVPLPSGQLEVGSMDSVPYGWIFAESKTTSDPAEADIFMGISNNSREHVILETSGRGGIAFISAEELGVNSDFLVYAAIAPELGYVDAVELSLQRGKEGPAGVYFVRTRDGKHFAKFYFGPSGYGVLGSEQEHQEGHWALLLDYVYDPRGSRNLEFQK